MKIAYLDAFAGIAGDMTVAALVDAGAPAGALIAGLESLGTGARCTISKVKRQGIAAAKFGVEYEDPQKHRHLPHIVKVIEAARIPDAAKQNALKVFNLLAETEAEVHGTTAGKVHFHEAGAVDSICDVVGACYGFHLLGVERIFASPVNTGSGTVEADHGVMPVPAPATALLLRGVPCYARGPETELTTPTGAALLAALAQGFGPLPPMRIQTQGFGAGTKEFTGMANVLRILTGEAAGAREATEVAIIEANIDDSTPQMLGYAMERLLEAGALDVILVPVYMKKQRPGVVVQAIARPEDREALAALLIGETTTLGVRIFAAERRVEARESVEVETPFGRVRMKLSASGAATPEYDDCRELARRTGRPLKDILTAATIAWGKSRA
jgi:uncharacterized protein (TIGR00299 family) protein